MFAAPEIKPSRRVMKKMKASHKDRIKLGRYLFQANECKGGGSAGSCPQVPPANTPLCAVGNIAESGCFVLFCFVW